MAQPWEINVSAEVVVRDDGSAVIPADQLAPLHVSAGMHLKVAVRVVKTGRKSFEGMLGDWPDLTWEDFERGSGMAVEDLQRRHPGL